MGNPYTPVTVANYNTSPPSDDGQQTAANTVEWAKHKDKLGDPLKTAVEATQTNITAAFAKRYGNDTFSTASSHTVTAGQEGRMLEGTSTLTFTLPSAATVTAGYSVGLSNTGTGTVTVTPDGSETINGQTTFSLSGNQFLWISSDNSNWTILAQGFLTGNPLPRGYIDGLILSTAADADHDIAIAAGTCRDDADAENIKLTAATTKRLDAPWAVGSDQGGLDQAQIDGANTVTFNDNGGSPDDVTIDASTWTVTPKAGDTLIVTGSTSNDGPYQITGTPTSTVIQVATGSFVAEATSAGVINFIVSSGWYHKWQIRRSDTGVVDALFSESASAPTLPASYDQKRRIGAVLTDGSANILGFTQIGNEFVWDDPPLDFDSTIGTTASLITVSVPLGVKIKGTFNVVQVLATTNTLSYLSSPDADDEAPSISAAPLGQILTNAAKSQNAAPISANTDTSSQVRARSNQASTVYRVATLSWVDDRGLNG